METECLVLEPARLCECNAEIRSPRNVVRNRSVCLLYATVQRAMTR